MSAAPDTIYFIGFADSRTPVVCFVGAGMRAIAREPRRLFALLKGVEAPAPLRAEVRVVSRSAGSAAVFALAEEAGVIERFAAMARTMGDDLLDDDPELPAESWTARKPMLSLGIERPTALPEAYISGRFEHDPDAECPPHRLARALWAIDRRARAIQLLEAACSSSTDPLDHFHLGELLAIELGRPQDGIAHLRRACELAPTVSQPFTSLGIALSMAGDVAGAVRAFERATDLDPEDFGTWANLAQAYKSSGKRAEMRRAAARAQELSPGEPLTSALLAEP